MIDRNGGYAIVDLKGKTLSAVSTTILGTHSAITKAIAGSKPILLTGLKTGGPCFVQVTKSGTSYVISGVYGKDITITAVDGVTVANVKAGGTLTWSVATDDGTFTFEYEKGMTFAQFVASDYNVDDAVAVDVSSVIIKEAYTLLDYLGANILGTDDIYSKAAGGIKGSV